jgi:hypothetical protein
MGETILKLRLFDIVSIINTITLGSFLFFNPKISFSSSLRVFPFQAQVLRCFMQALSIIRGS